LSEDLLRSHVRGRSRDLTDLGSSEGREAKIGDVRVAGAVDHHVRGLEVAMNDPAVMSSSEAGSDLARDVGGLRRWQASDAPEQRG